MERKEWKNSARLTEHSTYKFLFSLQFHRFIDGYRYRMAYIAAQAPLQETAEDFWRMLWEHNSTIVVMLTKLKEMGKEKCFQYWPDSRSIRYMYYVVDPVAEYNMPQYKLREFKVTDARDGSSRTVSKILL